MCYRFRCGPGKSFFEDAKITENSFWGGEQATRVDLFVPGEASDHAACVSPVYFFFNLYTDVPKPSSAASTVSRHRQFARLVATLC